MDVNKLLKSVIDQDDASVVICSPDHTIVYMNPAAIRRNAKSGGAGLLGKSLLNCHSPRANVLINQVCAWFQKSPDNNVVYTFYNEKENKDVYMVALRDEDGSYIGYYEKHVYRTRETRPMYEMP